MRYLEVVIGLVSYNFVPSSARIDMVLYDMSDFDALFCLLISEVRLYDPSLYSAWKFGPSRGIGAVSFAARGAGAHAP